MSIKKCVNGSFVNDFYKEYGTDTDTITSLPKTIIGDGQSISSYTIKGNMTQSGTPTPSNPIYPTECGDKTANLFDFNTWYSQLSPTRCNVEKTGYSIKISATANDAHTGNSGYHIPVSQNTTYTFYYSSSNSNSGVGYIFENGVADADHWHTFNNNNKQPVTFTTRSDTTYIILRLGVSATGNYITYSDIMLNSGSPALPYEPYGYKIPISLNNVTYPIYISEPLRKSLDGSNLYDTIESNGTLTRRVDANGDALATPTTEQVTVPTLTTTGTAEQFNVLTTLAPSEVSLTYHGWHEHSDTKYTTP